MKRLIVFLLFVPFLLFGTVVGMIVKRIAAAPGAFSIKEFPMPSIGDQPQSDDARVIEGWKVFSSKGCVFCHGVGGTGGIKNPNAVGGEIPSLLKVAEGYSEDELKDRIRKGVKSEEISTEPGAKSPPPLYMPSWKDTLTEKEVDDVAYYLMSLAPKKKDEESWE